MSRRAPSSGVGRALLEHARMAPSGRIWAESPVRTRWTTAAGNEVEEPPLPPAVTGPSIYTTRTNSNSASGTGFTMSSEAAGRFMVRMVTWWGTSAGVVLPTGWTTLSTGTVTNLQWAVITRTAEASDTSANRQVICAAGAKVMAFGWIFPPGSAAPFALHVTPTTTTASSVTLPPLDFGWIGWADGVGTLTAPGPAQSYTFVGDTSNLYGINYYNTSVYLAHGTSMKQQSPSFILGTPTYTCVLNVKDPPPNTLKNAEFVIFNFWWTDA